MKNKYTIALAFAGIMSAGQLGAQVPGQPAPAPPAAPKLTDKEAFTIGSYVLGYQQGRGMHGAGFNDSEFSTEELLKGLVAGLKGEESSIPEAKMRAAMEILQKMAQQRAEAKMREQFADKIKKNEEFLATNAKREGVKTTSSGLQYEVLTKGGDRKYVAPAGGAPDMGTKFVLHYKGTLIDGTEFDSSRNPQRNPEGKPVEFGLNVVPGFAEALKTMPVGAKWKVYLPSELGYRPEQRGPGGPFSVLIFEIELIDIKSAPASTGPGAVRARATTPPVRVPAPPAQKK